MHIYFFNKSFDAAIAFSKKDKSSCAMWYKKGLTTYNTLGKFIKIDSITIEFDISSDFIDENPLLVSHAKYSEQDRIQNLEQIALKKPICFFASNDTIVNSFKPIIDNLSEGTSYKLFCRGNENAHVAAEKLGLKAEVIETKIPEVRGFSSLVLGNDWGYREQKINISFQNAGLNSICIQESSIDFNPIDRRMKYCSFPIFQGPSTLQNIDVTGRVLAIIGNPRFEKLQPKPIDKLDFALINVNFTYGIFEEARDIWVKDVVESVHNAGFDYIISQHPRDKGDLKQFKVLKSNPFLVHSSIENSTVVISRFSALLTEAVCMGRPAIYYNPHGENMHYKLDPDGKMLFNASNTTELEASLGIIKNTIKRGINTSATFVEDHLGVTSKGLASKNIARCIESVSNSKQIRKADNYYRQAQLNFAILKNRIKGHKV